MTCLGGALVGLSLFLAYTAGRAESRGDKIKFTFRILSAVVLSVLGMVVYTAAVGGIS